MYTELQLMFTFLELYTYHNHVLRNRLFNKYYYLRIAYCAFAIHVIITQIYRLQTTGDYISSIDVFFSSFFCFFKLFNSLF